MRIRPTAPSTTSSRRLSQHSRQLLRRDGRSGKAASEMDIRCVLKLLSWPRLRPRRTRLTLPEFRTFFKKPAGNASSAPKADAQGAAAPLPVRLLRHCFSVTDSCPARGSGV